MSTNQSSSKAEAEPSASSSGVRSPTSDAPTSAGTAPGSPSRETTAASSGATASRALSVGASSSAGAPLRARQASASSTSSGISGGASSGGEASSGSGSPGGGGGRGGAPGGAGGGGGFPGNPGGVPGVNGRPLHSTAYLTSVMQRLTARQFTVSPAAVLLKQDWSAAQAASQLSVAARAFATNNKTNMLGVQGEAVLAALVSGLIAGRESGNIVPYLKDLILGVNLGPTVARSHVNEYRNLEEASIYRSFEIKDRVWEAGDDIAGNWVENCDMNATAVRWAGLIIYTFATADTFLGKVAAKTGTILNPPVLPPAIPGVANTQVTREQLLVEAAGTVTPAFRIALADARPLFKKSMEALDQIYGDSGPELGEAMRVAGEMVGYEI